MENEEVVVPETTTEVTPEVTTDETVEEVDWKSEAEKAKELANNYKIRAEKAERGNKEPKVETKVAPQGYDVKDISALSKVNPDDIDDVVEAAKILKIPVHKAIGHNVVKTILAQKEEERTSSAVANTTNVRRGQTKISDDQLLANANSGKLPESDEEINRLYQIRAKRKGAN